jgi:YidC/Oxa1 family membrane protein insertase
VFWAHLVEALRALIFGVAQVCNGSLGAAVCLVSFALRLALLPLTLRLARRALAHQRRLLALRPELEQIQKRHKNDPEALWSATAALYRRRGVKPIDPAGIFGGLAQAPILGAFFAALRGGIGRGVRFLGIGDLSLSNITLSLLVTAVTIGSFALAPSPDPTKRVSLVPLVVMGGVTLWFLTSTSSLFALATGAGSLVNVLQSLLLRREARRSSA